MAYCVMRSSRVLGKNKLPRPKLVTKPVFVGTRVQCEIWIEDHANDKENTSDENISIRLSVTRHNGQKEKTSLRPGNGSRAPKEKI
jgi:hypothetical protein